jgi:hypothetical protein
MFTLLPKSRLARCHQWPRSLACGLWLVLVAGGLTRGQESSQFLPEIDNYLAVNSLMRLMFQAKQTREGSDPTEAELGPSMEFYLKPWIKLHNATIFDLDEASKRAMVFSVGYRLLDSTSTSATNRFQLMTTGNFPVKGGFLVSDRNRADLDWQNGRFDWIYRNRVSVQRALNFGSYHPKVYVRAEEYYRSRYSKWSTTALYAGSTFPLGHRMDISPYYVHQNNTGGNPNRQLNQFGLIANFYFSVGRK